MESKKVKVLAIPGSLRKDSYNKALLEEARRRAPKRVEVEVYEDGEKIPLYNQDMEGDLTPEPVLDLRARIRRADAVLVASPEYNGSISGVLKNLIDWASRPYGHSAFNDKPVAAVGASGSRFGAKWSQETALTVLGNAGAKPIGGPHPVPDAANVIDSKGKVSDPEVRKMLKAVVNELGDAVRAESAA